MRPCASIARLEKRRPRLPQYAQHHGADLLHRSLQTLGIIYTAVFGGFSDKTLSDRIHNAGASVVITSDGSYRNAQVAAFKEDYTDKALDNYIPLDVALSITTAKLKALKVAPKVATAIVEKIQSNLKDEITTERADVMRAVGQASHTCADFRFKRNPKFASNLPKPSSIRRRASKPLLL